MAVLYEIVRPVPILVILIGLATLPLIVKIFLQYWRLRHIPGPWQAKLTNFWLARRVWRGENFPDISRDLDKRFGRVVAYGPNRILFNEPTAIGIIFNTRNPFPKPDSYNVPVQAVNGKLISTFITERSEARISIIKKQIIGAFSTNAILAYEHHIDHNITRLMDRFTLSEQDKVFNIATWNIFFAMDTICNIAFSDNQGLVERQADIGRTLQGGKERLLHWHNWQSLPWLEELIFKNRWATRGSQKSSKLGELATERLQERMEKGGRGNFSDLLDRYLQARERDPATFTRSTILGLVMSIIAAGGDTTSSTINVTLYYLLANPRTMAKLKAEISQANLSFPPAWVNVSKLHYLDACIKEAGRLRPLLLDPLEREVPVDSQIAGVFVPAGTVVAVNTHALNLEPEIWGSKTHEFRPERWLDCDEQQLQKMERCDLFFSGGRRICIGQHIAWIEMKKYITALLLRFEIEAVEPNAPLNWSGSVNLSVDELMVRIRAR
ncbi:hypothetical protein PV08_09004 [Exophiala spinifera]|uniref:Pisatin demethylase n=1 Tax=Exophiala spinifera TaxID=91928 RepID=A0A0D1ZFE5_9EURO|nr:uncharacterized protein PV08_09004 [Exophiala spinifera]KIW11732.1 hypothetical protein PV08_09004 [Exophiala spinifera]